jgi:hypothetical protein
MDDEFLARFNALRTPSSSAIKDIPSDSDLETRLAKLTGHPPDVIDNSKRSSIKYSIPTTASDQTDELDLSNDPELDLPYYEDSHINVPDTKIPIPSTNTPKKQQYVDFTDLLLASPTLDKVEVNEADFLLQQVARELKLEEKYGSHDSPSTKVSTPLETRLQTLSQPTVKSSHSLASKIEGKLVLGAPPAPISLQDIQEWCCKCLVHVLMFLRYL